MGWTHHEVGKVDVGRMANILQLARVCGFSVPLSRPPPPRPAAATAAAATIIGADAGTGGPRGIETFVGGGTPGGSRCRRPPGRGRAEEFGRLGGGGGQEGGLPRPDGVASGVVASGSSGGGSSGVQVGSLSTHPPLAGGGTDAARGGGFGGAGVVAGGEGRGQQRQGEEEEEEEEQGQSENSTCRTATSVSQRKSSVVVQAGGKHCCGSFAGTGATQTSGVGVLGGGVGVASGRSSEGTQRLQGQLPPAHCRVVVVGAGASGLSAAACLRARGEDGVVVLERCVGWLSNAC